MLALPPIWFYHCAVGVGARSRSHARQRPSLVNWHSNDPPPLLTCLWCRKYGSNWLRLGQALSSVDAMLFPFSRKSLSILFQPSQSDQIRRTRTVPKKRTRSREFRLTVVPTVNTFAASCRHRSLEARLAAVRIVVGTRRQQCHDCLWWWRYSRQFASRHDRRRCRRGKL
jgi:hypothetical protein